MAERSNDVPPLVVVMGVSGSGKSTVGEALAGRLGVRFVDGDDLHPASNVAKMAAGHPLTDDDRWPWLARIGGALADARETGLVVACSALKKSYRDVILAKEPRSFFVHLAGPRRVLESRLGARHGHFMPPSLLDSQLATLEPLRDEPGAAVDISGDVGTVVDAALAALARHAAR
ncbi:MAG TPA: gluconokinase [Microbacteriaceae bacterium]|nr:gluconokinase [Microbacteriaceae bacterium]